MLNKLISLLMIIFVWGVALGYVVAMFTPGFFLYWVTAAALVLIALMGTQFEIDSWDR